MKKLNLVVILLMIITSVQGDCQISEREYLRYIITFADDSESRKNATRLALERPDLLEEIILLPKSETTGLTNRFARQNAFVYLLQNSQQKKIPQTRFFMTAFKLLKNISLYVYDSDLEQEKKHYIKLITTYGYNPISRKASVDLPANLEAFLEVLDGLHKVGFVSGFGPYKKLNANMFAAIQAFIDRKKNVESLKYELENNLQLLESLTPGNLREEWFQIIQGFLKNLLTRLRNKDF